MISLTLRLLPVSCDPTGQHIETVVHLALYYQSKHCQGTSEDKSLRDNPKRGYVTKKQNEQIDQICQV